MASSYPTALDNFDNPTSTSNTTTLSHAEQHSNNNDAIEALEAKVGVNNSSTNTSLDYKLTNTSSSNPGHKHTLAQGATDVTASAAELNVLDGIPATLTATELGYVDGVTSAIQTQLGNKIETSYLDTDGTLAANSDTKIATQKATKTYADGKISKPGSEAQGDVLYHNGTAWSRLAAGTDGYFLKTQGSSANPIWAAISAMAYSDSRFKVGNFTRSQSASGGDVAYTGVGFQPKAIVFCWGVDATSSLGIGFSDGTNHGAATQATTGNVRVQQSYCIQTLDTTTWEEDALVKTFDSDGFTLTWSNGGSPPSATIEVIYIAFR
jgi:hypothetical protein